MSTYLKHDTRALDDHHYPQVTYGEHGDLEVSPQQSASLFSKWKQAHAGDAPFDMLWAEFAKTVNPTFGMGGAITVRWCGMWLAIEKDGYCHS